MELEYRTELDRFNFEDLKIELNSKLVENQAYDLKLSRITKILERVYRNPPKS